MTCREDSLLFASHRVCALRGAYIGPIYRAESRASKHEARSDWLYENRSALIVVGLATPAKRVHCNDAVTRKHRWPALSLITPCLALSFPAREQPSKCRESFRVLWNGQSVSSRNSAKEQCSRKRKVKFLLSRPFTIDQNRVTDVVQKRYKRRNEETKKNEFLHGTMKSFHS